MFPRLRALLPAYLTCEMVWCKLDASVKFCKMNCNVKYVGFIQSDLGILVEGLGEFAGSLNVGGQFVEMCVFERGIWLV
jgi:hypothetical protein